jgi:hypothetical protein
VDLSALIFVALAVAWAVYLIPKALKHHEDDQRSRTVDNFSTSMRVLARREPVDSRTARLVVEGASARPVTEAAEAAETPAPAPITRAAAARAARRRRRVLALILVACATVGALAAFAVVPTPYAAAPVALLVAWLVACRLMVRSERAARTSTARPPAIGAEQQGVTDDGPVTEEIAAVEASVVREPGSWDPVPVTLPTYVSKEPAGRRSVRTIDLDSTGVWTSGHDESDSRLAREADEAREVGRTAEQDAEARRAAGS